MASEQTQQLPSPNMATPSELSSSPVSFFSLSPEIRWSIYELAGGKAVSKGTFDNKVKGKRQFTVNVSAFPSMGGLRRTCRDVSIEYAKCVLEHAKVTISIYFGGDDDLDLDMKAVYGALNLIPASIPTFADVVCLQIYAETDYIRDFNYDAVTHLLLLRFRKIRTFRTIFSTFEGDINNAMFLGGLHRNVCPFLAGTDSDPNSSVPKPEPMYHHITFTRHLRCEVHLYRVYEDPRVEPTLGEDIDMRHAENYVAFELTPGKNFPKSGVDDFNPFVYFDVKPFEDSVFASTERVKEMIAADFATAEVESEGEESESEDEDECEEGEEVVEDDEGEFEDDESDEMDDGE